MATASAWSPLRRPLYRMLWIAALIANVGLWMQNVGAAWLMTSLTPSATMIALVLAALSGPTVPLALLAGALADVFDSRRLLLWTQLGLLLAVGALGLLTLVGAVTPGVLLLMTTLFGVGVALSTPAWQAVSLEVVPGEELPAAVSLNGVSINLARAIGPLVGGLVVATAGPAAMFFSNALLFVVTVVLLWVWRRQPRRTSLPPEHLVEAMQAGARFVRYDPALRTALLRTAVVVFFGSGALALLPIVARGELGLDALGYGALLGCFGVGAVLGAFLLPRWRRAASTEALVAVASGTFAVVTLAVAFLREPVLLGIGLVTGGVAWLMLLSLFVVAALATVPTWVRARATSVVMLVFFGGMTVGSIVWGLVAQLVGTPGSLTIAALGLVASLAAAVRFRLSDEVPNLAPAHHWPEPQLVTPPSADRGPVLVMVEYRIDAGLADEFREAMSDVRLERLRNGAMRWGLFSDPAEPGRYVEMITIHSWLEHERSHGRVTVADSLADQRAKGYQSEGSPTVSTHLIAEPLPEG